MITSLIGSLIIGLIIGAIARFLMPGRDEMGCLMTALLGIGGSFVGGFIGNLLWRVSDRESYIEPKRLGHLILSVIGAVLLLWVLRAIRGRN
jgi:uncharacterized membrane protein YeaQ/YmgE (transglycosylase-associated protein family)